MPGPKSAIAFAIFAFSLFASIILNSPGCTSTGAPPDATVQLTMAGDTLAASETLLAQAETSGLIPASVAPQVKASILTARAAYKTAVVDQGQPAFAADMATLNSVLASVVQYRTQFGVK
jgi:hypothetical protein